MGYTECLWRDRRHLWKGCSCNAPFPSRCKQKVLLGFTSSQTLHPWWFTRSDAAHCLRHLRWQSWWVVWAWSVCVFPKLKYWYTARQKGVTPQLSCKYYMQTCNARNRTSIVQANHAYHWALGLSQAWLAFDHSESAKCDLMCLPWYNNTVRCTLILHECRVFRVIKRYVLCHDWGRQCSVSCTIISQLHGPILESDTHCALDLCYNMVHPVSDKERCTVSMLKNTLLFESSDSWHSHFRFSTLYCTDTASTLPGNLGLNHKMKREAQSDPDTHSFSPWLLSGKSYYTHFSVIWAFIKLPPR